MAKKTSALSAMSRATGALVSNLPTVLMLALPFGILAGWLNHTILGQFGSGQPSEEDLAPMIGAFVGIYVLVEIILGPILAAMSVYTARSHTHGTPAPFMKGFNFALNRYGRMLKWHAIAWLTIHFGLALICIPGLLFVAIYAFVDPILCLEKEPWPLARSKKLTRGRRRTIFLAFLPWLIFSQIVQALELFGVVSAKAADIVVATGIQPTDMSYMRFVDLGTLIGYAGLNTLLYGVLIWTYMCFYMVYEDRTTPKSKPASS